LILEKRDKEAVLEYWLQSAFLFLEKKILPFSFTVRSFRATLL
jgi:hypothetical protein